MNLIHMLDEFQHWTLSKSLYDKNVITSIALDNCDNIMYIYQAKCRLFLLYEVYMLLRMKMEI